MFSTIDDVVQRFAEQKASATAPSRPVVYLAAQMGKPILVEGHAGVGKTEPAEVLSRCLGRELIRLQCYEGLDEAKALYEWEYGKQLLYTQILKDKIGEVLAGTGTLREAIDRISAQDGVFFSERFILPRPLLRAITSEQPVVLLVDEIDKSDNEFEAFLLEILSDVQVSLPELGTISTRHIPLVILTSNNSREVSDALKRRCLHLFIDYPSQAHELEIIKLKVPEVAALLARDVVAVSPSVPNDDLKSRRASARRWTGHARWLCSTSVARRGSRQRTP
jgi:MoxR-like ATPase